MQRFKVIAIAASAVSFLVPSVRADEDFYATRLRTGIEAMQGNRTLEAIDEFRVACFGLMEQPTLLEEALARLALAQQVAGRSADVDATLTRFLEVERRFSKYGEARLDPKSRKDFEALAIAHLKPDVILSTPGLAHLIETEDQKFAKLPPKDRMKAIEAKAKAEPTDIRWPQELYRDAATRNDTKAVIAWATKALELDPKNVEATTFRARARTARRDFVDALTDLKALPSISFSTDPTLNADLFVCLAAAKDWKTARPVLELVPEALRTRPDVASAEKKLPAEKPVVEKVAEKPTEPVVEKKPEEKKPAERTAERKPTPKPKPKPTERPAEAKPTVPPPSPDPAAEERLEAKVAEARTLLQNGKNSEAKKLLAPLAKPDVKNREFRKTLMEAAYLAKDWKLCAAQVPILEPFADGEEPAMFYAAVSLFETGNVEDAQTYVRRARPKIASNAFVDYYTRRILGKEAPAP